MATYTILNTGYQVNGSDISGGGFVTKDYIRDAYPNLMNQFKIYNDDNQLWMWGGNAQGGVGDYTTTNRSSPVQTDASGQSKWFAIATEKGISNNTVAIKSDNSIWAWGNSTFGQVGYSGGPSYSPVRIREGSVSNVTPKISCGTNFWGCIINTSLYMIGNNAIGQLGDNTRTNRSSLTDVQGFGAWSDISCGFNHTAAIKTDGTLWSWGQNAIFGSLGDNTTTNRSSPVQVYGGGTNWKQVSAGGGNVAAIKNDGTLWTWGYNLHGGLGDNTSVTSRSSPVQTVAGGATWKQVSCGDAFMSAVTF